MGIRQIDLLVRNQCTIDLSYDPGFCVPNVFAGNFGRGLCYPPFHIRYGFPFTEIIF